MVFEDDDYVHESKKKKETHAINMLAIFTTGYYYFIEL